MDIKYLQQHGDFALTMVNDIVLVNAKGPWNTECVENFGLTYAGTVYKSGMLRWADIVVLDGESTADRQLAGNLSSLFFQKLFKKAF